MPRILCHGKPGHRRSASSPSRIPASLISRSLRSTAATVFGSFPERLQIHATHELDDHVDAVEDISQGKCRLPKRQGQPRGRL